MTALSIAFGLGAIAMFWWANSLTDTGPKSTLVGGLGLLFVIASVLTTPAIVGHEACVRYSPIAQDC